MSEMVVNTPRMLEIVLTNKTRYLENFVSQSKLK